MRQDLRARPALKVHRACRAFPEFKGRLAPKDRRGHKVRPGRREPKAMQRPSMLAPWRGITL